MASVSYSLRYCWECGHVLTLNNIYFKQNSLSRTCFALVSNFIKISRYLLVSDPRCFVWLDFTYAIFYVLCVMQIGRCISVVLQTNWLRLQYPYKINIFLGCTNVCYQSRSNNCVVSLVCFRSPDPWHRHIPVFSEYKKTYLLFL